MYDMLCSNFCREKIRLELEVKTTRRFRKHHFNTIEIVAAKLGHTQVM